MISERSARCLTSPRAVRQNFFLAAIINSGKKQKTFSENESVRKPY